MIEARTTGTAAVGGLFEHLAEWQLATHLSKARSGESVRPRLPYAFEAAGIAERDPGLDEESPAYSARRAGPSEETAKQVGHAAGSSTPTEIAPEQSVASPAARDSDASTAAMRPRVVPAVGPPADSGAPRHVASIQAAPPVPRTASEIAGTAPPTEHIRTRERIVKIEKEVRRHETRHAPSPPRVDHGTRPQPSPQLLPRLPAPAPILSVVAPSRREPTIEIHIGRVEVRAQVAPSQQSNPRHRDAPVDTGLAAHLHNRARGVRS